MKRIFAFFLIWGLALIMSASYVNADCSVSVSDYNPSVGDSFTVTVYYSGAEFGSTDGILSYDSSILELTGCSAEYGGGGGEARYSYYQTSGDSSMAVSFYFTVIGTGDGYVSASADSYDVDGNYFAAESSGASFSVAGGSSESETTTEESSETETGAETETESDTSGGEGSQAEESEAESNTEESEEENNSDDSKEEEDKEDSEEEENKEEDKEEESEENKEEATPFYVYVGGEEYVVQKCKTEDMPSGFGSAIAKYEGSNMEVLRSKDKKILLSYLKPSWAGEDEEAYFFYYDEGNESFHPAEFTEIAGAKYLVTSEDSLRLYGEDGYYYYNEDHGKAVPEDIAPLIAAAKEEALKAQAADLAKAEQEAAAKESAEAASQPAKRSPASIILLGLAILLLILVAALQAKLLRERNRQ